MRKGKGPFGFSKSVIKRAALRLYKGSFYDQKIKHKEWGNWLLLVTTCKKVYIKSKCISAPTEGIVLVDLKLSHYSYFIKYMIINNCGSLSNLRNSDKTVTHFFLLF